MTEAADAGQAESTTEKRIREMREVIDKGDLEGIGIGVSLGIRPVSFARGEAVYALEPTSATINGMFTVQGGVLASLLDAAMGSAVYTELEDGVRYTTLEIKVNLIRSVALNGPRVTCTASTIHVGKSIATVDAHATDPGGKLIAHGTSTCMIFGR